MKSLSCRRQPPLQILGNELVTTPRCGGMPLEPSFSAHPHFPPPAIISHVRYKPTSTEHEPRAWEGRHRPERWQEETPKEMTGPPDAYPGGLQGGLGEPKFCHSASKFLSHPSLSRAISAGTSTPGQKELCMSQHVLPRLPCKPFTLAPRSLIKKLIKSTDP